MINDFAIQDENEIECIGSQCSQNGITLNWLKNPHKLKVSVTKGLILELRKTRLRHNFSYQSFAEWIFYLSSNETKLPKVGSIQKQLEMMNRKQIKLLKTSKEIRDEHLKQPYKPPSGE